MSLRLRLALLFSVVVAVGIGIASYAAWYSSRSELRSEIDRFLETRADEIVEGVRLQPGSGGGRGGGNSGGGRGNGGGPADDLDAFIDVLAIGADSVIQVIDDNGLVIGRQGGSLPVDAVDLNLAQRNDPPVLRDVTHEGVEYRLITRHIPGEVSAVQVARDLTEMESVLARLRDRLLAVGFGLSVMAALAGWLVARRTTRPLRALTVSAEHIAVTQDLTTPIAVDGADEVGRLASSFDTMLDALATSREQQHRLVMDAGHELRTPLTSLRTNIELLQRAPELPDAQRAEMIGSVTAELGELTDLVTELIELATDTRDEEEPLVDIDLAELVERAVERARRRTGRHIDLDAHPSLVSGRPALLDRAVTNLLGNAHKFSPAGSPITVLAGDGAVAVRDQGPGIPESERQRVFDRFYRSPRHRDMPGSGLGLAIVTQIVERHGGRVWSGEAPGGGAEVGFALPEVPAGSLVEG